MKQLSLHLLAQTVLSRRKTLKITQVELSKATGINRGLLSRLESENYTPSVDQLQALSEVLGFQVVDVLCDPDAAPICINKAYRIAVAGTGYVGLSLAVLLAQHNDVTAVDTVC